MLEANKRFYWSDEAKAAFKFLKDRLLSAPILAYPNFNKEFILDTDASDKGIGAVFSKQDEQNREHPIAYYSRSLNKHERNYYITRKELLAAIDSIEHFRCYLYGRKFLLRTDHVAIQWLRNFKEPTGQLARWLERLTAFDYTIQHRPGRKHANDYALSRKQPEEAAVLALEKVYGEDDAINEATPDALLQRIITWVENGSRPQLDNTRLFDQEGRTLWARFDEFAIIDPKLCLLVKDGDKTAARIIPARNARKELISSYHSGIGGWHLAFEKTYLKIKDRFYWPKMKKEIKLFCYSCERCGAR